MPTALVQPLNCVGMIEDVSRLQSARRKGIATAMIAAFTDRLRADGCHAVLLGALASEQPKHLYAWAFVR